MLTTGVGLLLFCTGFLLYDLGDFRVKKVNVLKSTADLLSSNAGSALKFDDVNLANQVLEAMRVRSGIRAAALFTLDDGLFSWYVRRDLTGSYMPPKLAAPGVRWEANYLSYSETVYLDGVPVGSLYLEEGLDDLRARKKHFANAAYIMAGACLALVFLLSAWLRNRIIRPIYSLADTARNVASKKDYSIRASEVNGAELIQLSRDFNLMLGEIERRDAALIEARDHLEQRVEQRTRELESEIVERKRVQEHLVSAKVAAEAASEAKSTFLATMSHEIRTPMNGILGMTELILDTELTREQRDNLGLVKLSADSLLTVINDILDFSKIEAGKLDVEHIPFDLRESLGETMKALGFRAQQKKLELIYEVQNEVPEAVLGDPGRIRQIIVNLVGNSIKFTEQGEILLSVTHQAETLEAVTLHFAVKDTGIGIPADKQAAVFEAFCQADGSTTRKYGGTGLGLAICKKLVQLMGGRLWVQSQQGEGSTFNFTIQLGMQNGASVRPLRLHPAELLNLEVLIVDDNETNRRVLAGMLDRWGMKPTAVEGSREALEAIEIARRSDRPFRLIVLDGHMPGIDGFALAEIIQKLPEASGTTVMMLTSASHLGDAARCQKLGISAYLVKPVRQNELLDSILNVLKRTPEKESAVLVTRHSLHECRSRVQVLLAEDNAVNQLLAVRLLEKRGYSVTVAGDGHLALAALEKDHFDVVLMDIQMPGKDGFEVTAAIREKEKLTGGRIPIIAMTAHALKGDRERCISAGMDGYVSKPIRTAELFSAMEAVLAGKLPILAPT